MPAQIDLGHAVAQLADVGRKLEASVASQLDGAPFDKLPAQELDRYRPCAHEAQIYDQLPWGGGMMGSAAPQREHEDNFSVVMSSPSSPMLLGSVKPGSLP